MALNSNFAGDDAIGVSRGNDGATWSLPPRNLGDLAGKVRLVRRIAVAAAALLVIANFVAVALFLSNLAPFVFHFPLNAVGLFMEGGALFLAWNVFRWTTLALSGAATFEIETGNLKYSDRAGRIGAKFVIPLDKIRDVTVRVGPQAMGNQPNPVTGLIGDLSGRGSLTFELARGKSRLAALGYSTEVLRDVGGQLVAEINLRPERTSAPLRLSEKSIDLSAGVDVDQSDRWVQPAESDVICDRDSGRLTLAAPPAGYLRGSTKFLLFFALVWDSIVTAVSVGVFFADKGPDGILLPLAFMSVFWLAGIVLTLTVVALARNQAAFAVVDGELSVLQMGLFRSQTKTWAPGEVDKIGLGNSGASVNDQPIKELQIVGVDGQKFGLLAFREDRELAWIGTLLREALGMCVRTEQNTGEASQ